MPTITRSTIVPYTPQQMFDLVNDIENYPQFLPWCPQAEINRQETEGVEATLHFAKGPVRHAFTTRNRLTPHERVDMHLVKGPFRFLQGTWHFVEDPQGSKIAFEISFEWNHILLDLTMGPFFNHIIGSLIEAFTQRARVIYATD